MRDFMAKFKSFQPIDWLTVGVVAVALIVSLVCLGKAGSGDESTMVKLQEQQTEIVNLRAKLSALSDDAANQVSPEDAAVMLKSASAAGTALAALQTEYQTCMIWQDGDTLTVEEKLSKQAESIGNYLSADSQGCRVPWFTQSNVGGASRSRFTWRFMTNYSFTQDTVECLWLCVDSGERLVAFATGMYTASQNKFSDIKWYATQYGNETYRAPEDPIPIWIEDVDGGGHEIPVQPTNPVDSVDPGMPGVPEGVDNIQPADPGTQNPAEPAPDFNPNLPVNPDNPNENLGWASEFEDEFLNSKEYREWVQSQKNNG